MLVPHCSTARHLVHDLVPNGYVTVATTKVLHVDDLEADEVHASNAFVRAIQLLKADVHPVAVGVVYV